MHDLIDNVPAQRSSAFKAGLAYFVVTLFGFLLVTVRMLVVVPAIGDISAVMLEMAIMLAISWFSSRWLVGRCHSNRCMSVVGVVSTGRRNTLS